MILLEYLCPKPLLLHMNFIIWSNEPCTLRISVKFSSLLKSNVSRLCNFLGSPVDPALNKSNPSQGIQTLELLLLLQERKASRLSCWGKTS